MDAIVFQYDAESTARIETIKLIELVLFATLVLTLLIEALFVFRPAIQQVVLAYQSMAERQKVAEAEARTYKQVAAQLPDLVWRQNASMLCTFISPSVTQVLGYQAHEWMGKAIHPLYHPEDVDTVAKIDAELFANGGRPVGRPVTP